MRVRMIRPIEPGQRALYRLFDGSGVLLYVGIAADLEGRLRVHLARAWGDAIASFTVKWYADWAECSRAEREAIRRENPIHNRHRYAGPPA